MDRRAAPVGAWRDALSRPLVVVTGATDGIGRETARQLVAEGADVVVHGRRPAAIEELRSELAATAGRPMPEGACADLSSLDAVREMGASLVARGRPIDALVNNAGVYMKRYERSVDGFEQTLAVNHLAPFLLTHLLLEPIGSSTLKRIVNVSSVAHARGRLELDDLGFERRGFDGYATYAASKLANVLFTIDLTPRVQPRGILVNALHPGVVSTKLLREGFGMQGPDSVEEGAATSVMLALDARLTTTGGYFAARRQQRIAADFADPARARGLYELSCRLVGISPLG